MINYLLIILDVLLDSMICQIGALFKLKLNL